MLDKDQALEALREELHPGDTVFCVLRHVSSSGMTRWISPMTIRGGAVRDWSYAVGLVTDSKANGQHEGVKRGGCGMDMGFDLVYSLSRRLFPDGFGCIGDKCPSNDHSNGDRDYMKHLPGVRPHLHKDGGYALHHRWL
jgi:hypothetical protein